MSALSNILVVALEHAVAAPFCTRLLADAGARVIKVERTEGDFARGYDDAVKGESTYFTWLNYGKESLVLNLKDSDDLQLLKNILKQADVLVQNFSPGSLDRLGLTESELEKINPHLIQCAIQGYGSDGPYGHRKAYDLLIQAESGLSYVTGSESEPSRVGVSVCDIASGMYSYSAILQALIERQASESGKSFSISMFDAMAEWMAVPLLQYDYSGKQPKRVGLRHPSIAPYGVYTTADERVLLIAIQNEREWKQLCLDVFADDDLYNNENFSSNVLRVKHREELEVAVSAKVSELNRDECIKRLKAAQIAYGDVNDIAGLSSHPHLKRLDIMTVAGQVAVPASPIPKSNSDQIAACPSLGQHSAAIKCEFS